MNSALLLALGSAVLYGAADFTGGLTTRRASTIPVVVFSQASGMLLLALMLPFLPDASPTQSDLLWGAGAGLTGGIGVALLYRALAIGAMSVVAPVTAVCAVALPVLFAVMQGERPALLAAVGLVIGVLSIILVSRQTVEQSALPGKKNAGVGMALASGVLIGLFFITFSRAGSGAGMWPLLVARLVSVSLFVVIALIGRHSLTMPREALWLAIACGVMDMLANALYLIATRTGQLSIVVTLSSLYPASTVLLARLVLKERLNTWQLAGVGCALAAVVLIVAA